MLGLCWSAAEVRIILNGNSNAAQISQKQELKSQGNRSRVSAREFFGHNSRLPEPCWLIFLTDRIAYF